jgi:AcrR family transcriptional regulator
MCAITSTVAAMARLAPAERRDAIVQAALDVMVRKGMAETTVRDVAEAMGTSSGLIHHYFASMDDLLAAAFARAAQQDLAATREAMARCPRAVPRLASFFVTYARAEQDWAFQLWLDAWAEAARRPAVQETSRRLNVAWQQLLEETIRAGTGAGELRCPDPAGAAWRILSMLDGLALQTVAHPGAVDRNAVISWSVALAERELGLAPGALTA